LIISDRHRYLFVELPRTGSTAVRRELRALYDGRPILTKHATYGDFLRVATEDQKRYFVFSSVRNPLDDAVSKYFKVKGGRAHGALPRGTRGDRPSGKRRGKDRLINRLLDRHMTRFVRRTGADFPTFFLHYYVLPYDTWASLAHHRFGLVMRFETLADDFEETDKCEAKLTIVVEVSSTPALHHGGCFSRVVEYVANPSCVVLIRQTEPLPLAQSCHEIGH